MKMNEAEKKSENAVLIIFINMIGTLVIAFVGAYNGLNVFAQLEYLLLFMPDMDWQNHLERLDNLMPWSRTVQTVNE